jgi:hypothetical protein
MGVPDVINIYIEYMTSMWLVGAHSHVPVVREAYMSRISTQAGAAIAVSLSRFIIEQHTPSMNRLFSLFCTMVWAFGSIRGMLFLAPGARQPPRRSITGSPIRKPRGKNR